MTTSRLMAVALNEDYPPSRTFDIFLDDHNETIDIIYWETDRQRSVGEEFTFELHNAEGKPVLSSEQIKFLSGKDYSLTRSKQFKKISG